ncbi:MAG: type II 3-dehydroquinate dehydratase [Bacillota bacterium]
MVINGPNLGLLGEREPEVYGTTTLSEIKQMVLDAVSTKAVVKWFQFESEGSLIRAIHRYRTWYDGVVINPGALSHTSLALHDAIRAVGKPFIEVHLSNIHAREEIRRHSVTAMACKAVICGLGPSGYVWAVLGLLQAASDLPLTESAAGKGYETGKKR